MYTRLEQLAGERYISLSTRRRDGSLASSPVWVVSDDEARLLVWTGAATWKARRIARDPRVLVAAADRRGRERSQRFAGRARLLAPQAGRLVVPLLRRKYGWQRRALELRARVGRAAAASVYIEIVPAPADNESTSGPRA